MAQESEFIFKNSTEIGVVRRFAVDVLGWEKTFAQISIQPDHSVALRKTDGKNGIDVIGVKMVPDQTFDESYTLLK